MARQVRLYNTLSRRVEDFKPIIQNQVGIYTCGPTVYSAPHIGNYRTYIFEDVLVKALRYFGYEIKRVMNITDVGHLTSDGDEGEDKLEVGAKREGLTAWEVAAKYEGQFIEELGLLHIEIPAILVRATATIPEQIALIQQIEAKGFTYITEDGVYFDSLKLPDYGKLAHLDIAGLKAGARVEMRVGKKNPSDFALWKFSTEPGKRHMEWQSPWGIGFPGWHIECSAIALQNFGPTLDIHAGGVDHIAVHHTNEIAQNEAATGQLLANYWMHGEFLQEGEQKMSKSANNGYTLTDLQSQGIDPLAFRLYTYSASYRSKLNMSSESLQAAQTSLNRLRGQVLELQGKVRKDIEQPNNPYFDRAEAALADDLNMPEVMAAVWELLKSDQSDGQKYASIVLLDEILSLDLTKPVQSFDQKLVPEPIKELFEKRMAARQNKEWKEADELRKQIEDGGYLIVDEVGGSHLEKINSSKPLTTE